MPDHPPERYAPGELDKTRQNLGRLSPEEAKKMSRLLGGEIGVERNDEDVEERYKKLKELNRRKNDRAVPAFSPHRVSEAYQTVRKDLSHQVPSEIPIEKIGFLTRVHIAFLASRQEHGILRRRDAWLLLLFPYIKKRFLIHPAFITSGDRIFYNHIERFVLSVRSLLARNGRYNLYKLKPGYYRSLLHVYRNWNIETLHLELARLQRRPRDVSINRIAVLYRELFKPHGMLCRIDGEVETEKALKHLFDLTLLSVPKDGKEAGIIKELYAAAREELYFIMVRIPRQCWPLLLYLTGSGYYDYHTFFQGREEAVLAFLGLDEKALITPPQVSDETPETSTEADEDEEEREPDLAELQETAATRGLTTLAELFPDSGWDSPETGPDMIPYFKPLCNLPKGSDILSPEDPLHQTTILAALISELSLGLRGMRFADAEDTSGKSAGEILERMAGSWHQVQEELIGKLYVEPLTEYCRNYERDEEFPKSRYGEKLKSELFWIKRNYLTPFCYTGGFKGYRPIIQKKLPRLFEMAAELTDLLSRILLAEEEGTSKVLLNPKDPFRFEVPGYFPLRLKAVLQRKGEEPTNLNLIKTLLALAGTLDYLLNNPDSWFYGTEDTVLFRSDFLNGSAPIYAVDSLDSVSLIRVSDERARTQSDRPGKVPYGGLKEAAAFISDRLQEEPSGVVFRLHRPADTTDTLALGNFIKTRIRDWIDRIFVLGDGLVLLVLPDTRREDAESLTFRLLKEIEEHSAGAFRCGAGVVLFTGGPSVEDRITAGVTAADKALTRGDGVVVLYRDEEKDYIPLEQGESPSETTKNEVE
ncbi:MAG: hypothetical protein JW760_03060 [Spirochaetales bacterium]|nr:hypothetical protein [Spirochaetales bacterium]